MVSPNIRLQYWKSSCEFELTKPISLLSQFKINDYLYTFRKSTSFPKYIEPNCDSRNTIPNIYLCNKEHTRMEDIANMQIVYLQIPDTNTLIQDFHVFSSTPYEAKFLANIVKARNERFVFGRRSFSVIEENNKLRIFSILVLGNPINRIYRHYQKLKSHRFPASCTTYRANTTFSSWYLKNINRLPEINNYEIRLLSSLGESPSVALTAETQCLMHYRYCYFPASRLGLSAIKYSDVHTALDRLKKVSFVGISDFPDETFKSLRKFMKNTSTNQHSTFQNEQELKFNTHKEKLDFWNIRQRMEEDNWGSLFLWKHSLDLFKRQYE
jgi:hypothetical protein